MIPVKVKKLENPAVIIAIITLIAPVTLFAATASIREARSDVYSMGIVPYYVYGYDVKINTAAVRNAAQIPVVAPLLPAVGGGGAFKSHSR